MYKRQPPTRTPAPSRQKRRSANASPRSSTPSRPAARSGSTAVPASPPRRPSSLSRPSASRLRCMPRRGRRGRTTLPGPSPPARLRPARRHRTGLDRAPSPGRRGPRSTLHRRGLNRTPSPTRALTAADAPAGEPRTPLSSTVSTRYPPDLSTGLGTTPGRIGARSKQVTLPRVPLPGTMVVAQDGQAARYPRQGHAGTAHERHQHDERHERHQHDTSQRSRR